MAADKIRWVGLFLDVDYRLFPSDLTGLPRHNISYVNRHVYRCLRKYGPHNLRSMQPLLLAGRIRRRFLPAVGLLLLVSILSSTVILFNVGHTGSTLQQELGLVGGESLGQSWRFVHATGAALAPFNTTERPTLAETFFTPECAEAWITKGALCDQITHGEITHDMRNALRMSIIHTWVNGSDKRLHTWKEMLVKKARPVFVISKAPGVAGRHFR
jgi:hypothetical protein